MTLRHALQRGTVIVAQLAALALLIWLWAVLSDHKVIDPVYFSSPAKVWKQLEGWVSDGTLWGNLSDSLKVFIIGYAIGTAGGIVLGVLIGTIGWLRELAEPFLAFFNAMPRLILLPLLIVWFGFGLLPKVLLVITVIILMVTLNVAAGIREVRTDLLANVRLMGASRTDLLRHVYIPSVALWVTSTARVTVGYAFNATIAAEFIGASTGLGYLIYLGESSFQAQVIWAALLLTLAIAVIMDALLAVVEARVTRWMPTT